MKDFNKAIDVYNEGLAIEPNNIELQNALMSLQHKIQSQSMNQDQDPEQLARAMNDPEIQQIMADPQLQLLLKSAETDPQALMNAMNTDIKVRNAVNKLVAAGIIKTA